VERRSRTVGVVFVAIEAAALGSCAGERARQREDTTSRTISVYRGGIRIGDSGLGKHSGVFFVFGGVIFSVILDAESVR